MVGDRRHVRRPGARRVGCGGAGDAARPAAILYRVPEAGRPVRRLGGGLPAVVHQPECAAQARCAGHGAAVGSGRSSALCAHHGAALRSGEPAVARHAQGGERRRGAPRLGEDRRSRGPGLAADHLDYCVAPLLDEPWVLDVDTHDQAAVRRRRKAPWSATTRTSPVGRRTAITPT